MSFKELIFEVTSWPQLISKFQSHLPIYNAASDWPHTFLCPRCFCLAYHYFLSKQFMENYKNNLATYPPTMLQLYAHFHNVIVLQGRMTVQNKLQS